jgi:hypothetical protein
MSANDNEMSAEFLLAAAAAVLITGLVSTAAAVIGEEEASGATDKAIAIACDVIASNLLQGHRKHQQNTEQMAVDEAVAVKRRFNYFDRERARECIVQDYLGLQPTFGPDGFKRIFRVSRTNYSLIHNYLGGVQSFFKDGCQVTNQLKIMGRS